MPWEAVLSPGRRRLRVTDRSQRDIAISYVEMKIAWATLTVSSLKAPA